MSRLIGIAIGIALFSCVACGGQHPASTQHPVRPVIPGAQPSVPAPAGAVSALPTLASLPRTASAANTLWGIQVAQARYATGADTSLVFANKSDDGSGDTIIQPRPAFAVYEFGDQPTPVGLHLTTSSNSQTKFWLGLANWQTGQWDFSPGQFLSSPTIQYAQMIANPDAYRSADGRV